MNVEYVVNQYKNLPVTLAAEMVPAERFSWMTNRDADRCFVLKVDEVHTVPFLAAHRPGYGWSKTKIFRRGENWFVYPGEPMTAETAAAILAGEMVIAAARAGASYEVVFVTPEQAAAKVADGPAATFFAVDIEAEERRSRAAATCAAWLALAETGDAEAADALLAEMPAYIAIPAEKLIAALPFAEACRQIAAR